ncbi:hypothetical protein AUP68_10533 [Ilyonectria robusta]
MISAPLWRRNDAVGLASPPPGVKPNFVDPPTLDHFIIGYSVGCLAASSCFVLLRIYTFTAITKTRDWADYLLVPAWGAHGGRSWRQYTHCCHVLSYGFGHHAWDIPFSTFNNHFMKVGGITGTFYGMSIMLTKLSILAFYLRFVIESGKLKGIIYATMVITILYSIIASFVWVYACQPLEKYWDLTITDGSCINFLKVTIFSGVMNTVTDAIILLLPIMILWGLSMPKRQKIGVTMIMMTGGFVVRLRETIASLSYRDFTWDSAGQIVWWTVEVHLALICACLPSLKPLLRRLRSTVRTTSGTSDSAGGLIPRPIYLTSDSRLVPTRGGDEIPLQTSDEAAPESKKKAALELSTTSRKASHTEEEPPLPSPERRGSLLV